MPAPSEATPGTRRGPWTVMVPVGARWLRWGAAAGAAVGAVSGFAIGLRTYLPTSPVAAVEGAVFGTVSGLVLAGALFALRSVAVAVAGGARRLRGAPDRRAGR